MIQKDLDSVTIDFDNEGLLIINLSLAVIMFGVALGITLDDFKRLLKQPKLLVLGLLSQFILLPFLTFIFVLLVKPHPSVALGMFMVAACPGGNISNFMSHLANANAALSIGLTAFATFAAMIMTPLNFQLYGNLYGPTAEILREISLDPMELVKVVILILGIPLALGMGVRHKTGDLAIKISKILKPISIMVFVAIVAGALIKNGDVLKEYVTDVLFLGIPHNILALICGFLLARFFGLGFKDQKAIAIETGIQNSGLGLLLIFTFFDGLGGMALIAAFWGIWHIISGLLLASYWGMKSSKTALA